MGTIREHTKLIDGISYTTTTFSAMEALVVAPKLFKILPGEVVGLMFATDESQRAKVMESPQVVGQIMANIATRAAEDDGLLVLVELLANTSADKVRIGAADVPGKLASHFDSHFTHHGLGHMFRVAQWVGQVNFTVLSGGSLSPPGPEAEPAPMPA
jgi:hypothetical protein